MEIHLIFYSNDRWLAIEAGAWRIVDRGEDYVTDDPVQKMRDAHPGADIHTGMLVPMDQYARFVSFVEADT